MPRDFPKDFDAGIPGNPLRSVFALVEGKQQPTERLEAVPNYLIEEEDLNEAPRAQDIRRPAAPLAFMRMFFCLPRHGRGTVSIGFSYYVISPTHTPRACASKFSAQLSSSTDT